MLFLQGTRDTLALLDQLEPVCAALGSRATLKLFAEADHSFHVAARSGRTDAQVLGEVLDTLVAWIDDLLKHKRPVSSRIHLPDDETEVGPEQRNIERYDQPGKI